MPNSTSSPVVSPDTGLVTSSAEERREHELLSGSLGVFLRCGIKSVTMDDIARQLGVSKKTLYRHFRDKRDLVARTVAFQMQAQEQMLAELDAHPGNAIDVELALMDRMRGLIDAMHPSVLYDLEKYHSRVFHELMERRAASLLAFSERNLIRGQREGVYRADFEPRLVARFLIGMTEQLDPMRLVAETGCPLTTIHESAFVYHIRAIASPEGLAYVNSKLAAQAPTA
ncbi:MAG: TetR/AcrR family transcriptional regulator [Flavobacteriales bacterium]|jgi:AcrR family transcriptional regulator